MAKKGMDILIKLGTQVLGGQRSASIEMSSETIDTTNKVSGAWTSKMTGFKSWTADCDGVFFVNDEGYKAAINAFMEGTEVDVELADASKTVGYKGKAIITSISVEAPYDDAITYAVSFEGNGALTEVAGE